MGGRLWTDDEVGELRRLYGKVKPHEIAVRLGRTRSSILNAARVHNLGRTHVITDRKFLGKLRRLNKAGLSDSDIALQFACDRHCVSRHRRHLNLPSQARGARWIEEIRAGTKRQCEAAGVRSLGELRALSHRIRAIKAGWPTTVRLRGLEILELLEKHGPMTRRQIIDALGMTWRGVRRSLKSNGPGGSYLAELMRLGLVVSLGRQIKGQGKGKSVHLYSIALGAERKHGS
jgi:hypothetical protein